MQILRGATLTVLPAAFGIALLIGAALAIAEPAMDLKILATDPAPDGLLAPAAVFRALRGEERSTGRRIR